jgi:hypothetical protein
MELITKQPGMLKAAKETTVVELEAQLFGLAPNPAFC